MHLSLQRGTSIITLTITLRLILDFAQSRTINSIILDTIYSEIAYLFIVRNHRQRVYKYLIKFVESLNSKDLMMFPPGS